MGCNASKAAVSHRQRQDSLEKPHYSLVEHLALQRRSSKRHHSFRNIIRAIDSIERFDSTIRVQGIVSDWDACKLADAIAGSDKLTVVAVDVELDGEACTIDGIRSLVTAIGPCRSLEELYLTGAGNSGALCVGNLLLTHPQCAIKTLHLASGNALDPEGICDLASGLRSHKSIQSLQLPVSQLDDECLSLLAHDGLRHVPSLTHFDASGNSITKAGLVPFCRSLRNHSLEQVSFRNNRLSDVSSLLLLKNLKVVKLGRNALKDKLEPIARMLEQSKLECLELDSNEIGAEGMLLLVHSLPLAVNLRELNLSGNLIGDEGARLLLAALPPSVEVLSLRHCNLTDKSASLVEETIRRLSKLRSLNLADNRFGDASMESIIRPIQNHVRIESVVLDRDHGGITNKTVDLIVSGLQRHRAIRRFSLKNTNVSDSGLDAIGQFLSSLQSSKARTMTTLCSPIMIRRLAAKKSGEQKCHWATLPMELCRLVSDMLYSQ